MKRILFTILTVCMLAIGGWAQSPTRILPDCKMEFNFDGTTPSGRSAQIDNRISGCTDWSLTYYSTGFSALSIQPEFASDSGGQPGAFTIWPIASVATLNATAAMTTTTESQESFGAFHPWVTVNLTTSTGTGRIAGVLYGWRNPAIGDSSTIDSSVLDPCQNPNIPKSSAIINVGAATTTVIVTAGAGTKVYVCGWWATLVGTTPTFKLVRGTGASCGTGTADITGTFAPTAGNELFGGPIQATNGSNAVCGTTVGAGSSAQGYASYVQQ